MTRPIIKAPTWGMKRVALANVNSAVPQRMIERLPEDSATRPWSTVELARQWHLRIGPKTRVIVTSVTLETQTVSHWRVEGIAALDSEHLVAGGPQMAATAAFKAFEDWKSQMSGRAA